MGHQDSHQVAQGPPHTSSSSAFAAAARLPYNRPLPEAPTPPIDARPSSHTLAHAALADARHQLDVLWHLRRLGGTTPSSSIRWVRSLLREACPASLTR